MSCISTNLEVSEPEARVHLSTMTSALCIFGTKVLTDTKHSVHAALPSNTLAVYGTGQTKELTELVPGILNQLGPDSLANLRRLAESYQSMTARQAAAAAAGSGATEKKEGEVGDDDEIPDLVENFEEAGEVKATELEELE